jgi:hypothetical protein
MAYKPRAEHSGTARVLPDLPIKESSEVGRSGQSKLINVRLEADDSVRLEMPHFCPRCSRSALSLDVAEWIFALPDGLVGYSLADYDAIAELRWQRRWGSAS